MLASSLIRYHEVAETVNLMVLSFERSGPAVLVDSSISFFTHLLLMRNNEVPGAHIGLNRQAIRWLFTRLNMGIYVPAKQRI